MSTPTKRCTDNEREDHRVERNRRWTLDKSISIPAVIGFLVTLVAWVVSVTMFYSSVEELKKQVEVNSKHINERVTTLAVLQSGVDSNQNAESLRAEQRLVVQVSRIGDKLDQILYDRLRRP